MTDTLKVSMVNTAATRGGAARAAVTLRDALNAHERGVEAELLHCDDRSVTPGSQGLRRPLSRQLNALLFRCAGERLVIDMGVAREIAASAGERDLLHLHNLHGYYLDWQALLRSLGETPLVWTWHDMWPVTGRCGSSADCDRWAEGCPACPHLDFYPATWRDHAARDFAVKRQAWAAIPHCMIVCPSRWMARMARKAGIPEARLEVIPNAVDLDVYQHTPRRAARQALGLPADQVILAFVAADCDDERKGYPEFARLVEKLGVHGLAVGNAPSTLSARIQATGPVHDKPKLSLLYSAADAYVTTSRIDNYPNTVIEAQACGTPAFGYAIGGIPEQCPDWWEGVTEDTSVDGMAASISAWLTQRTDAEYRAEEFAAYAASTWGPAIIARSYADVYRRALALQRG